MVADRLVHGEQAGRGGSMLSIGATNGYGWQRVLCNAIQQRNSDAHHYDDDVVRDLFQRAAVWARTEGLKIPDLKHAENYIESRNEQTEPVIPEFVRRYCAHATDTKFQDWVKSKPKSTLTIVASETLEAPTEKARVPCRIAQRLPNRRSAAYA